MISLGPNQLITNLTKKCLTSLGPQIRNSLPVNIKSAETFEVFKKLIKNWDGEMGKCRMCTYNKNQ